MCVGSSVAAISATISATISAAISAAICAAIANFRVRRNKVSHRKLAINWQLGNFGLK